MSAMFKLTGHIDTPRPERAVQPLHPRTRLPALHRLPPSLHERSIFGGYKVGDELFVDARNEYDLTLGILDHPQGGLSLTLPLAAGLYTKGNGQLLVRSMVDVLEMFATGVDGEVSSLSTYVPPKEIEAGLCTGKGQNITNSNIADRTDTMDEFSNATIRTTPTPVTTPNSLVAVAVIPAPPPPSPARPHPNRRRYDCDHPRLIAQPHKVYTKTPSMNAITLNTKAPALNWAAEASVPGFHWLPGASYTTLLNCPYVETIRFFARSISTAHGFASRVFSNRKIRLIQANLAQFNLGFSSDAFTAILEGTLATAYLAADREFTETHDTLRAVNLHGVHGMAMKWSAFLTLPVACPCTLSHPALWPNTATTARFLTTDGTDGYVASEWATESFLRMPHQSI
ncbi:hypothetical protein B0J18DRAFT_462802 [Chaetomium sp. MPI-SDFR-AT-0129]|nr:hypothetical protein B0J18DRAFT_462802 [Chaetomium sp. MPI-SDFR-AT-0129]